MKIARPKSNEVTGHSKHMVKTLQIISIQHELAMATGSQIELEKMLLAFLQVSISRLKLTSAHIFLFRDTNGWPETRFQQQNNRPPAQYFTSIPSHEAGQDWSGDLVLAATANSVVDDRYQITSINNKQYHSFSLPEHGVIVFCSRNALDTTIISALKPIFLKLAQSCNASILHESLKREMDAREQAESELLYKANHNETTDLPNSPLFLQQIKSRIDHTPSDEGVGAVICIHLDQLQDTNNLLGHHTGNELQRWFAKFLQKNTRREDSVGQIDAETFVLLLPNISHAEAAAIEIIEKYVVKLHRNLRGAAHIGTHTIAVSFTTGFTLFPSFAVEAEELITQAEIAKFCAKKNHKKKAVLFDTPMLQQAKQKLEMETALAQAIEQDSLSLWWQPQYDMNHHLISAEALLRWHTPEHGFVSPGIFIPLAEESDLILKVGDWVLRKACQQLATLVDNGIPQGFKKLSINVNARQLIGTQFVEDVISVSEEFKLPHGIIGLELTESTFVQGFEETVELITRLQNAGFDCSLDDFGTGYSSLSYLRKLPIKTIKIDQSFVRDLHLNKEDQAIARTVISLGEYLHRDVIAEGVETKEEFDCLIEMGCEQFQGYYFDKPMPVIDLMQRWSTDHTQHEQRSGLR